MVRHNRKLRWENERDLVVELGEVEKGLKEESRWLNSLAAFWKELEECEGIVEFYGVGKVWQE